MKALLAALFAATPALAEPPMPQALQGLIAYHTTACEIAGGTLTIGEDALVEADLNGDGQPDVMLDSSKLDCPAAPAMFCAEGTGCELSVFVGEDQHTLIVLDWAVQNGGDRQQLKATIAGHLLQRQKDVTAWMAWDDQTKSMIVLEEIE